jgi:hypothetical protein
MNNLKTKLSKPVPFTKASKIIKCFEINKGGEKFCTMETTKYC